MSQEENTNPFTAEPLAFLYRLHPDMPLRLIEAMSGLSDEDAADVIHELLKIPREDSREDSLPLHPRVLAVIGGYSALCKSAPCQCLSLRELKIPPSTVVETIRYLVIEYERIETAQMEIEKAQEEEEARVLRFLKKSMLIDMEVAKTQFESPEASDVFDRIVNLTSFLKALIRAPFCKREK